MMNAFMTKAFSDNTAAPVKVLFRTTLDHDDRPPQPVREPDIGHAGAKRN